MDINEIITEYGTYLYNYALKLTCHPVQAEDLAQETFIQAWRKLDQLKEKNAIKKWLRTICYHQFLMDCRKCDSKLDYADELTVLEQEGSVMASELPTPEEEVFVKEEIKDMQNGCFYAMVRRLTLPQRMAFSLVDMFGLSMDEAAEMLEISVGALKGLLYRARMNLDSFFADHCNLMDAKNPCSCEEWIHFRERQNENKTQMRKLIQHIDYKEKGYLFDEKVRAKVAYLYKNMPEKQPGDEWFQKVMEAVKN